MDWVLAAVLSLDTLFVCMAYAAQGIRIPLRSKAVLAGVGTLSLTLSLLAGGVLSRLVGTRILTYLGAAVLLAIGLENLFSGLIKGYLEKRQTRKKTLHFNCFDFSFILDVYVDGTKADRDHSKTLSPAEALLLAVPLSADSLLSGLSILPGWRAAAFLLPFSFVCGVLASFAGNRLGRRFSGRSGSAWLSGIMLILIALLKIGMEH